MILCAGKPCADVPLRNYSLTHALVSGGFNTRTIDFLLIVLGSS